MDALLEVNGIQKSYPKGIIDLEHLLLFVKENEVSAQDLVTEVKLDGEVYSEDFAHQAKELSLQEVEKVEIATNTQQAFARDFWEQAPQYLTQLQKGFLSGARLLRDPRQERNGYDMLTKAFETLLAFTAHLDNVSKILNKGDESERTKTFWERFKSLADQLIESQERQDAIAIADLLEGRMIAFLDEWRKMLRESRE